MTVRGAEIQDAVLSYLLHNLISQSMSKREEEEKKKKSRESSQSMYGGHF